MTTNHTPCPWFAVQPEECNGWWVVATDGEGRNTVDASGDGGFEEEIARLISAAPELLSAALAARDVLATAIRANWEGATDDDISNHVTIKRLDNAIDKATGD